MCLGLLWKKFIIWNYKKNRWIFVEIELKEEQEARNNDLDINFVEDILIGSRPRCPKDERHRSSIDRIIHPKIFLQSFSKRDPFKNRFLNISTKFLQRVPFQETNDVDINFVEDILD